MWTLFTLSALVLGLNIVLLLLLFSLIWIITMTLVHHSALLHPQMASVIMMDLDVSSLYTWDFGLCLGVVHTNY